MLINVTLEHIAKGQAGECDKCPIALALIDAGLESPHVGDLMVDFIYQGEEYLRELPEESAIFVDRFDCEDPINYPVSPFSFTLDI